MPQSPPQNSSLAFAARSHGTGEPLIMLEGVGVRRGGHWLVRGVDMSVSRGEIVTLIGPNGSGKSTTAKAAVGILRADEGTVRQTPGLTIGYVPQKISIDWTLPLTVRRLMTLSGPAPEKSIAEALSAVGAAHLGDRQVAQLSGGEFQRALLARALLRSPDLLVLDEPMQGVDFHGELALYELIRSIRDRTGCGIMMISHDLHIVMAETDTVICLNGHVCCKGAPESVAGSREYQELFGTRAAGKLALYRHQHDHTHLSDGRVRHADGTISKHCHPEDGHHHSHDHAPSHHHQGESPSQDRSDGHEKDSTDAR